MKLAIICGARPNFMKVAPLIRAIKSYSAESGRNEIEFVLIHTGQHYDHNMSKVFFDELNIPEPDFNLTIGSGTHAEQTAKALVALEKTFIEAKPDIVVVVGDVNSTLAAALAAAKLNIPIAHIEAGLRSLDRSMPEEINRLCTDVISNFLFTTSADAVDNLVKEGIPESKIFNVGNIMIDNLFFNKIKAEKSTILSKLNLEDKKYALVTLHRQENVDNKKNLSKIVAAIETLMLRIHIVFPIHPRTRQNLEKFQLTEILNSDKVSLIEPLGHIDFLKLVMNSSLVLTDSGGIQEETTALKIPCLTVRENTERPVTVEKGSNVLVGTDTTRILEESIKILDGQGKKGTIPDKWDGKTSERIIQILAENA